MTEKIYKEILSKAGVDFSTVSSGILFIEETSEKLRLYYLYIAITEQLENEEGKAVRKNGL